MLTDPSLNTSWPVWLADPINRSHPRNRGLVAWWMTLPGWEGGSFFYDLLGLHTGSLTGFTDPVASGWRGATRGGSPGCLKFSGADTCYVTHTANPPTSDYTAHAAFWSATQDGNHNHGTIYSFGSSFSFLISVGNGTVSCYNVSGGWLDGTISYSVATWNTATIVKQGTARRIYLNGKPDTSDAAGGSVTWGTSNRIGMRMDGLGGSAFSGYLNDLKLIDHAWTDAEVAENHRLSLLQYPGVLNRFNPAGLVARPAAVSHSFGLLGVGS